MGRFIDPMLLLRKDALPEGKSWFYEVKFDGYRALGLKPAAECISDQGTIKILLREIRPAHENFGKI